ncbi:MAG: orotidine-5'-phosphate decarboxylase [Candidatus Anaerobiospirillum merdipullorum]|uniref:Orotidine 5'-phosphate decarboxylase n=1 Tax=Candidatus Anaerobiospirillum merdipullorum TaxID=2838450 RepID=A0A9E2KP90_9GAMM|nr:orotidine-5'-phosphate decarboxylase [Candidatus Anaerobiospirillum merdipullorum]
MSDIKIFTALDFADAQSALAFASKVSPQECGLKVGKELFTAAGPALVEQLVNAGFKVFLDLKFHDIPVTVAKALTAAASLGVYMFNVHCLGGKVMLETAAEAVAKLSHRPLLIGVTVLTSMDEAQLRGVGVNDSVEHEVLRLATLAKDCGLNGVVCSAKEATMLRQHLGANFLKVTPGIRPQGSDLGDQKRVLTPIQALQAGADYLVIGRPITKAPDPLAALRAINAQIATQV